MDPPMTIASKTTSSHWRCDSALARWGIGILEIETIFMS